MQTPMGQKKLSRLVRCPTVLGVLVRNVSSFLGVFLGKGFYLLWRICYPFVEPGSMIILYVASKVKEVSGDIALSPKVGSHINCYIPWLRWIKQCKTMVLSLASQGHPASVLVVCQALLSLFFYFIANSQRRLDVVIWIIISHIDLTLAILWWYTEWVYMPYVHTTHIPFSHPQS